MFRARLERHSQGYNESEVGPRRELLSFIIEFPRIVIAEVITHRLLSETWEAEGFSFVERTTTLDLSKNSASSRAIPLSKMTDKVKSDPYMPFWSLKQPGMQGSLIEDETIKKAADDIWLEARNYLVAIANTLDKIGIHKQDANRLLEPFAWVTQIVTGTRQAFSNFWAQRCHSAAHPAFRHVARMMYVAQMDSTPEQLDYGMWHLPFVPMREQRDNYWFPPTNGVVDVREMSTAMRKSIACCCWVSYENHDKECTDTAIDRTISKLCVPGAPAHGSPMEHQNTPFPPQMVASREIQKARGSNHAGWLQARKLIPNERQSTFAPSREEVHSWGIKREQLWPE